MVVGVYDPQITEKIATVMSRLGVERAFVVSGKDHMDEFTTTADTVVSEIKDGKVTTYVVTPEQFGFSRVILDELQGGDGTVNAEITKRILQGEKGAKRDIVLLNAGAAIYIAGKAESIQEGIKMAEESIDSGKAMQVLQAVAKMSNEAA